ncbi:hypothetical protein EV424DRAFT_1345436 [Suillus variegatus]|nr:hypothetical protein EV424DRAFT_1345436 [Suillus variegatus]
MADAGFFKGTSADQDRRFSDKELKLLKSMKFPSEFDKKVDLKKVNLNVIRPWIAKKVTELVGFEDEVVVEYAMGLLDDPNHTTPDPKKMQINLTGFLTASTPSFMTALWSLLLEAQEHPAGVPQTFVEEKKEEMRKAREGDAADAEGVEAEAEADLKVVAEAEITVGVDVVAAVLVAGYLVVHRPIAGAPHLRTLHLTPGVPDPRLLPSDVRALRGVPDLAVLYVRHRLNLDLCRLRHQGDGDGLPVTRARLHGDSGEKEIAEVPRFSVSRSATRYARRRSPSPRRRVSISRSPVRRRVTRDEAGDGGKGKRPARRSPSSSRMDVDRLRITDEPLPQNARGELKIKGQARRNKWDNADRDDGGLEQHDLEKREKELKERALRNKVVRTRKGSSGAGGSG